MYDLYVSNEQDTARFILGKSGKRKLFVIGLNPSTANKEKSDTTVAKVEKVATLNQFDGFVMANLYPLRSTDPSQLPNTVDEKLIVRNIEEIKKQAASAINPVFWAAWGGNIVTREYLKTAFHQIDALVCDLNGTWVNYGELLKGGHPRHPSRLSYSWSFQNFDPHQY